MPYVNHVHGKFFTMENGDEPDIRYSDVVRVLLEEGYTGWMNSEFEGMAPDTFIAVQEHQAMIHRYIAQHASS
jgi:nitrogen regulatory protein PII-like uncharacterized protein